MSSIYRRLYGDHWFLMHTVLSILLCGAYYLFLTIINIDFDVTLSIISGDTISLSAEIAGFVFAGMSIFISLEGNKKMDAIKKIDKQNIIYHILIASIVFFVLSLILMGMDLTVLMYSTNALQLLIKSIIEWVSIYFLLLGFIYFLSSLQLIYWIFKR